MFAVAGLGNPGPEYAEHRHNIGFLVADELGRRWSVGWKSKFAALWGLAEFGGVRVVLAKPQEFMNLSGPPVERLAGFFQIPPAQIIVVHDEIDLDFGRLKVKVGGGHGGHNGLRSLCETVGPAFIRIRCGVGHPGVKERVVGHVLGAFSKAEYKGVPSLIQAAADAVEKVIKEGVVAAMNQFNGKDLVPGN